MKIEQIICSRLFMRILFILAIFMVFFQAANAQGFLRAEGKKIVNENGENVILRGIGTGNWMLMEGYMMKTEGVAGTQHEFEQKLTETIGEEKTKEFFNTWLENHFTKTDVDSMKAWGFNSVRVAMHYKWFTPPIEEEIIPGNITWIFKGFQMIDKLLSWCKANEMYLILDLHAAPGGQGKNADISDYDPSKPSLWESDLNKDKTVALWRKIAERYASEQWIGGYDILNETNWTFPEGNNSQMRELFGRITDAIREVDRKHIIFIEGNSFANDHSGLTPPWDDNLVYSFHKYWSGTTDGDLDWIKQLRDEHNVPLWMGESGENSNTWFTDFITTCENNNIGWSWWPVKKNSINNVLNVPLNKEYENLIKYWRGQASKPSEYAANQAILKWAENHKIENCIVQYDVIDAMIRQPYTNEVIPFKKNNLNQPIYFSDFDLGKNGYAYFDNDVAYYGGDWTAWNTGWGLRNDGVDIEECSDTEDDTNGFNVGWTETDEWMQYTLHSDSTALYKLSVRHASGYEGSKFTIEINEAGVTTELTLPGTNGWQNWETTSFENILIPAGKIRIKYYINQGGSNLSYFKFHEPKSAKNIDFKALAARTSEDGSKIYLSLNKNITAVDEDLVADQFQISINGQHINSFTVKNDSVTSSILVFSVNEKIYSDNEIQISYNGNSVISDSQELNAFSNLVVENNLPVTHVIPGQIEAEDFHVNNGLSLENCSDAGGGKNTSYAAPGEYLDYQVHVTKTGIYSLNYRVATEHTNAEVIFQISNGDSFIAIDTLLFSKTGGWQTWKTQSSKNIRLEQGYYFIRLLIKQGEHNLNWFSLDLVTSASGFSAENNFKIYPNPVRNTLLIETDKNFNEGEYLLYSSTGKKILSGSIQNITTVDVSGLETGMYIVRIMNKNQSISKSFIVK